MGTPHTIVELKSQAGATGGPVALMVYKMEKWGSGSISHEDPDFHKLAYNYSRMQLGKFSDTSKVKGIFQDGTRGWEPSQYSKLVDWEYARRTHSDLTFGFWMTLTFWFTSILDGT